MNSEIPTVEPAAPLDLHPALPERRRSRSAVAVLIAAAFLAGIVAALWAAPRIHHWWTGGTGTGLLSTGNESGAISGEGQTLPGPDANLSPATVATLEGRVAAISQKLDGISERATAAGGNAARAEGLLIAFATRRSLDRGAPLGYLEGELRMRFGEAQPRAVATIINAANAPITIADLAQGLDDITPRLLDTDGHQDWWTATKRELANLVIVRKATSPSPVPQKAIERAKLMVSSGRVDNALKEIERLPQHRDADNWLQMARQYNEARRALDVIEAAAILEPHSVPVGPRPGATNVQVAPPPPVVPTLRPAQ